MKKLSAVAFSYLPVFCVFVFCAAALGQATYSGHSSYSGAGQWSMVGGLNQLGAALPINWVNAGVCATTSYNETEYVDGGSGTGHYPETPAGLLAALQAWAGDGNPASFAHIIVTAGALLHGSTFDANNSLITLPAKTGATGCAVIESSNPPAAHQILCSHGLPGYGGTRDPGCTTDIANLWTLRVDSAPIAGYHAIFACGGNNTTYGNSRCATGTTPNPANHILLRDMEVTVEPGAFQSAAGVDAPELVKFTGSPQYLGIEYSYMHGWDPGDPGQPSGACSGWTNEGYVTSAPDSGNPGTSLVTWQAQYSNGINTYFGPTFTVGSIINIGGTNYTIANTTYTQGVLLGVQNTQLSITGSVTLGSNTLYTQSNPPSQYANGCGDDVVSGIAFSASNSWVEWSYIEKIHWWAGESHAFSFGFSTGPYKVAHNWIEGGSAALFSGGSAVDVQGGPANDGEIRGNFLGRNLGYRFLTGSAGNSPAPPWGCGTADSHAGDNTCPMSWAIKNSLELKLGNRVLIDGNMLCCSWADGQSGYVIVSDPRTTSGGTDAGVDNPSTGQPMTVIGNVTLTNNWISNAPQGMELGTRSLGPGDGGGLSQPEDFLTIANNVWSNIGDTNEWGSPGGELVEWGGFGANDFSCTMSQAGGVATAACSPILLANDTEPTPACGNGCGLINNAVNISSMSRSGGVVTVKFDSLRQDPAVGQTVTVNAPSNYAGAFTVSGVYNTGVNTLCSSPDNSQPQPCVRSNGTFGDSLTYSDSRGDDSGCTSISTCNTLGVSIVIPTPAFQMTDMNAGDPVYTLNCSGGNNPTSYQAGATSFTPSISPTSPTSLNVYYNNAGTNDSSGTICELENNSGHPNGSILTNNTVLTPTGEQIISGGTYRQHYNNQLTHNIFTAPAGTTSLGFTCNNIPGEGNVPLSDCWDTANLASYDNLIVNQSASPPAVLCSGNNCYSEVFPSGSTPPNLSPNSDCPAGPLSSCMGWTGFTVTGGSGNTFPTGPCSYDGSNPYNCPLMALPWNNNFSLSELVPLSGSSYTTEGANIPAINTALIRTQYVCPAGSNCGTPGPYPD
jgi:hypothetical protein